MRRAGVRALLNHPLLLAVRAGERPGLLLLDYDGTLAPFNPRRGEARPYPGVREALARLPVKGPGRFILVSGREAREAASLLGLSPAPEVWGCHGGQRLLLSGESRIKPLSREQAAFLQTAPGLLRDCPSGALELKPLSLALHGRGLPKAACEALLGQARTAWQEPAGLADLELRAFDGGLELRPADLDKGAAVRALAAENPGAVLICLGDDQTDEDAFKALGPDGLGVLVRDVPRRTAAVFHIRPPAELLIFLGVWPTQERFP